MLRYLLSALSLVFATSAAAAPLKLFPAASCPAVGEEYEQMLSKLDSIKASIKDGANCSQVVLKVKSLEQLLSTDRQKILEIIDKGRTEPLDAEQAKFVKGYAEDLTTKVASLFDLFSGSNQCFSDDKANEGLTTLAGFVNEASQLVSTLAGPWATPITLAGNVVAGFLTGLDQVMKTRAGYDFSKPENWKSYVKNVCTFYSYRDQIDHLLNPSERIRQLSNLRDRLETQMTVLRSQCDECKSLEKKPSRELIEQADKKFPLPLGTYTVYAAGIRKWVNNEILRVEKESNSFWADVSGRHLLSQARDNLDQFLFQREAPRFIQYQVRKSSEDFEDFQNFVFNEGRSLYNRFYYVNRSAIGAKLSSYWPDPVALFRALVIDPIRWDGIPAAKAEDLRFIQASFRDRGLQRLRTAESTLDVVRGFCGFFQRAGYYSGAVADHCNGAVANRLGEKMDALESDLTAIGLKSPFAATPSNGTEARTPLEGLELFVKQLQP